MDLCNETECEGNEKLPNIHEGSTSGNIREMEPLFSLDKEKVRPPPCMAGTENSLLQFPDNMLVDNKN